jgi:hypothetical protein
VSDEAFASARISPQNDDAPHPRCSPPTFSARDDDDDDDDDDVGFALVVLWSGRTVRARSRALRLMGFGRALLSIYQQSTQPLTSIWRK